ncbi:MAG: bifunctional metallophosphatase/5'-nucleotidase [Planctomycetaceae bacterium]
MSISRRNFVAGTCAGAACLTAGQVASALGPANAKRVTLLHLTDSHAQLESHWEYFPGHQPTITKMGGFARLKTAVDQQRSTSHGPAFLVDGGDLVQGSGPAAWSEGEVMIEPANLLELDAFVPGNWEPVYGPAQFEKLMRALKTQVVAYNFHYKSTGSRIFEPAAICKRDGVKVAFIGLADPTTTVRQPPKQVEGLDSTRMHGLREYVQELRRRERPDVVVAVTHTGLSLSRQLAREIPELDVVLSGHTHERTEQPIREGNVLVVEAGSNGSFLGRLDLTLKPSGGIDKFDYQLIPIHATEFSEDAAAASTIQRVLEPHRKRMNELLCETKAPILRYDVFETNADNLISDAIRQTSKVDIGFTNGFRFAPPIVPGPFTRADLWNLLPLDTRMKKGWVTGKELRSYLENELELVFSRDAWKLSGGWGPRASGLEMTFEATGAPGQRLQSVRVDGEEVNPDRQYTIAGCEREGEPLDVVCRLRGTHDVEYLQPTIHQAMEQYLVEKAVIAPARQRRSRATDLPEVAFSQDTLLASFKE